MNVILEDKEKIDKKAQRQYRIGNYRLFYLLENDKLFVVVVDFIHRQQAYD